MSDVAKKNIEEEEFVDYEEEAGADVTEVVKTAEVKKYVYRCRYLLF
jgi:hypothetical protein